MTTVLQVQYRQKSGGDIRDDLFRNFAARPLLRELEPAPEMRLDVTENESCYLIKADIPGVTKDDISVSIDGNQVSISAEVKRESESKDDAQLCSERYYGRVFRSFRLAADVDQAKAEARYDNGVLNLTCPKGRTAAPRRSR